jgi:hypothetical protein
MCKCGLEMVGEVGSLGPRCALTSLRTRLAAVEGERDRALAVLREAEPVLSSIYQQGENNDPLVTEAWEVRENVRALLPPQPTERSEK